MPSKPVTVKVAASTSNLGSGFDTLGLALNLYNFVRVAPVSAERVKIVSPLPAGDANGASAMAVDAANLFFRRARRSAFGIDISFAGDVPVARGLGFSATVRVGVIAALNELTGAKLNRQQLLELATRLEGHPDNATPAIFGGFTVTGGVGRTVRFVNFPVPPTASFVTLIPRFTVSTEKARALMPGMFSRADAVHALNRASLITAAFASGNLETLRGLFDDRVHQPYRERLIPRLSRVIRAGERAGAIGGWLSGSGSAIICLALEKATAVAQAMRRQLPDSEVKILKAENEGLSVL